MEVEIKDLPQMDVAYVRNIGNYINNPELFKQMFEKLCVWAAPKNLIGPDTVFLAVYYDDPNKTEPEKLKMDMCMTVSENAEVEGDVQKQSLPTGKFAVARLELKNSEEYGDAWNKLYSEWLPQSGEQPDERPCYEIYRNNPEEHPEKLHIVDLCVPLK